MTSTTLPVKKWGIIQYNTISVIKWPGEENAVLWHGATADTYVISPFGQILFEQLAFHPLTLKELVRNLSELIDVENLDDLADSVMHYLNQFKIMGFLENITE